MNKHTTASRGLTLLLALMLVVTSFAGCTGGKTTPGAKTITLQVVHKDGSQKEFTVSTDAEYLGEALKREELIAGDEGEYGLYVKTVDGETVDDANQEWWCLTKDGEMPSSGVDTTPIADGETYVFTLTVGY